MLEIKCKLGELIEERGFRKKFVAKKLGVSPQTISNWINDRHYIPMDKAFQLSEMLNCKVDDLYEKRDENEF